MYLPSLSCVCDELQTSGDPPSGPLATRLARRQFLLDFTPLFLTSAALLWLQKVKMMCCVPQASPPTGIQMSSLYGERRSRISRLTRVKGNQALSLSEDARYPPERLLSAGQKTNEKPTRSDRSYSQTRPRGFYIGVSCIRGCYLDEQCLGAQPRAVLRVKGLKVGLKPSWCAFVSPSSLNNGGWDKPLCRR